MDKRQALINIGFSLEFGKYKKFLCEQNGKKYTLACEIRKAGFQVETINADGSQDTNGAGKYRESPLWEKIEEIMNELEDEISKEEVNYAEVVAPEQMQEINLPAPVGINGIVRPAVTAAEALAAWNEFQALKNFIIEKSDIQVIKGKNHIKKSGWRKFATFYNLTDEIVEEAQTPLEKGGFYWKIKVVCTAPNGRKTEGVGMCASSEKSGERVLHDTYTTAHTRAKNRAISDMIAAGEVSAEEMA